MGRKFPITKFQFPINFQSIFKFVISTDTTLVESGEIPFSKLLGDPSTSLGMTEGAR